MSDGKDLRREKLALRDELSATDIDEKSRIIINKVLDFDDISKAKNVFTYVNFRSEVKTNQLIEKLLGRGKKISVPLTHVKDKRMDAIHIEDMNSDLVPGYCNIPEPHPDRIKKGAIEPQNIDIVIIPGSVFDERGGRMGYGGGFYDRFLEKIPYAIRVGLAFEIQVVDEIPLQPHDELLDFIVTEERTIEAVGRF